MLSKYTKTFIDEDNWQTGELGNTSVGKEHTLLGKHEVSSLDPQQSHKNLGAADSVLTSVPGEWRQGDPWSSPAS